ncbi:MAG: hypothetical protein JXP34_22250 [Planctomycetes bacterium]|nr:hypothetical protein [Planctomycetota bacterium]
MKPFLFIRKALHQDGPDRPSLFAPSAHPFFEGCYLAFPRDYPDATLFFDGRWLTDPNPVHVAIGRHYAEPIIGARDPRTGLAIVLMAERKDCLGLVSAYDREPLDGIADHNSIYLNLNGRDAASGETLHFRIRARIGRLDDPAEALEIYRAWTATQPSPSGVGSGPGSGKGGAGAGPDANR